MMIIGPIEDQAAFLIMAKIPWDIITTFPYSYVLMQFIYPYYSPEPFIFILATILKPFFGLNYVNVIILASLITSVITTRIYFKDLKFGGLYSLIFVFCSYTWLHIGIHLSLSQIWLYPTFMLLLRILKTNYDAKKILIMSLFFIFATTVSNYIGFFILMYFILHTIFLISWDYYKTKRLSLRYIGAFIATLIPTGMVLYLMKIKFITLSTGENINNFVSTRALEDFFYFSSRPWYFLIPSPKHIAYGGFATKLLEHIKATGYFLADDYFAGEHGASFFGYFLLLTFFISAVHIAFRGERDQKINLVKYGFVSIVFGLLMMPPFFTLHGVKIYTPGYLVYALFPMFRTTVRMSIILLLNMLIILADFFDQLYNKYPAKRSIITIFIIMLTTITIFETFIPVKVQYLNKPPIVYEYLGYGAPNSKFIVYPYQRAQEAVFWVDVHKSYLLNPYMYKDKYFDSETFTNELNTYEGLSKIQDLSIRYLIVFKNIPELDKIFFLESNNVLNLEKEFEDAYIFTIMPNTSLSPITPIHLTLLKK